MHHVEITPLLHTIVVALLLLLAFELARISGWKGRVLLAVAIVALTLTNPSESRHAQALRSRASPSAMRYHDFLIFSALSVDDRAASVGCLGRVLVARTGGP